MSRLPKAFLICALILGPGRASLHAQNQIKREDPPSSEQERGFSRYLNLQDPLLSGSDVLQLQQRLEELGYLEEGDGTGSFDAKTQSALRRFQRLNNLYPFGELGLQTQRALDRSNLRSARDTERLARATFVLGVDGVVIGGRSSANSWIDSREVALRVPERVRFEHFPVPSGAPGSIMAKRSALREIGTIVAPDIEEPMCEWSSRIFPFVSPAKGPPKGTVSTAQGITVIGEGRFLPRPCTTMAASAFPDMKSFQSWIEQAGVEGGPRIHRLWKVDMNGDRLEDWVLEIVHTPETSPTFPSTGQLFDVLVYISSSKSGKGAFVDPRTTFNDSSGTRSSTRLRSLMDADGDGTYELVLSHSFEDPIGAHAGRSDLLMKLEGDTWQTVLSEGCGD